MTVTERKVPVPGGDLAVLDYGGSGRDVLLIHSTGHNAHTWIEFAPALARHAHVYAYELRSHGQSRAEVTDGSAQSSEDVLLVAKELGLDRPILIGHEFGGMYAAAAAREADGRSARDGEIGGLVLIDSPVVDSTQAVRELVDIIGDETVLDLLVQRFGLGRSGPDRASMEAFADEYVAQIRSDRMARTFDAEAARALILRGITVHADGSWIRRPSIEAIRGLAEMPDHYPYYPGRELLESLSCPIQVITLDQGHYVPGGDVPVDLAAAHPHWDVVTLEGDAEILNSDPDAVVCPIVAFLQSADSTRQSG